MHLSVSLLLAALVSIVAAHQDHSTERTFSDAELEELENKWGTDWGFSGISTFAHLPHVKCLTTPGNPYDIGILGAPFDTAVSYRPGKSLSLVLGPITTEEHARSSRVAGRYSKS